MAAETCQDLEENERLVEANLANGQTKAARHELLKLQRGARSILAPELDELKKEMAERGRDEVLGDHPELAEVVERLDEIEERMGRWARWEI